MGNTRETASELEFIRWARSWSSPSSMRLPDGNTFPEAIQIRAAKLASTIGELLRARETDTADVIRVETSREALATARSRW